MIEKFYAIKSENKPGFYNSLRLAPYDAPNFKTVFKKSRIRTFKTTKAAAEYINDINELAFENCYIVEIVVKKINEGGNEVG